MLQASAPSADCLDIQSATAWWQLLAVAAFWGPQVESLFGVIQGKERYDQTGTLEMQISLSTGLAGTDVISLAAIVRVRLLKCHDLVGYKC